MLQVTLVHLVLLQQHHLLVLVKLVSHLKAPLWNGASVDFKQHLAPTSSVDISSGTHRSR